MNIRAQFAINKLLMNSSNPVRPFPDERTAAKGCQVVLLTPASARRGNTEAVDSIGLYSSLGVWQKRFFRLQ